MYSDEKRERGGDFCAHAGALKGEAARAMAEAGLFSTGDIAQIIS
jgi:hypothetical protein